MQAARAGRHIALCGGSTPGRAYELAAALEPDWSGAHIWFGDERAVAPDDDDSNFRLVREHLLDRVEAQPTVHRIRGELGAALAAEAYEEELHGVALDLVLLGVGPDGHTASLFPHAPSLAVEDRRVVAAAGPPPEVGPTVERVTLTIPALRAARQVVFLVRGAEKAEPARRAFADEPSEQTPASLVRSQAGETIVLLDRDAALLLPPDDR
ncbi:MAG: 6-phosphogluconolactonase [Gaiellaceae bacterium]|nr:6-phosphogluconolactonase [Gaiellaceae bacterium]